MGNQIRLDRIDREILFQLRRDGRLTNVELARRVGLTPPPCLRRVKRLEDAGVISGYRAVIDPAAVGRGLEVAVADHAAYEAFLTSKLISLPGVLRTTSHLTMKEITTDD